MILSSIDLFIQLSALVIGGLTEVLLIVTMEQQPSSPTISQGKSARSAQTTPTLPSKFKVPPLPPRIHRRLILQPTDEGLLVKPSGRDGLGDAVLISWGPKGTIQRQPPTDDDSNSSTDAETLKIGGILGITRLWATAYLLIFIDSPTTPVKPIKIFPPEEKRSFPALPLKTPSVVEEGDPLLERLRAIAEREGILPPSPTSESQAKDWKELLRPGLSRGESTDTTGTTVDAGTPQEQAQALQDDEEDKGMAQGTVFELRNVYAVPLAKAGAEGLIKQVRGAMAKVSSASLLHLDMAHPLGNRLDLRIQEKVRLPLHLLTPPIRRRFLISRNRQRQQRTLKHPWKRSLVS